MKIALVVIGFVALFSLAIWWQVYKFEDCKKVGHSTFYCFMSIGK